LLLNSLVEALKEGVGQTGTLVFPSFSYSFCKGKIFDVQKTKSTVGVLSEFFRKLPETSRTKHPIFSCSVTGKNSESYLNVGKDSFDEESIFGRLHKNKGKLLFLGAPFQSCTYIHYVEQMHGIPYRFLKTFSGEIKDQDESWPDECTFFVRYLDKNVVLKTDRLERYLLENGYMKEASLGNGRLLLIDADTLFKEGCKLLDEDIYYFLAEKPE
jgi:aminoglycoside 3-N-acetyltransferase